MSKGTAWIVAAALLTALAPTKAAAQQFPLRSHFVMNPFQDHAAVAGFKGCLDMHFGYRAQWVGIPGAPKTAFANIHGVVAESGPHLHGFGARVETDEAGAWGYTAIQVAYSYNMKLSAGGRLAMGVSAGLMQHRLNTGILDLPDVQVANDLAIVGASQFALPMLDLGLWYNDRANYVALTLQNVAQPDLYDVATGSRLRRHFVMMGGTAIDLNGKWKLKPAAQLRAAAGLKPSFDILGLVDFDGLFALGAGYRTESALVVLLQIEALDYISVGYAYDMNVSMTRFGGRNTHEIVIGLNACDGRRSGPSVPCPAYY